MKKSRYWSFLIYPDSAPFNFLEILESFHVPCAVSPCHNIDRLSDGTYKKPHYHVIVAFGNTTTSTAAQEISDSCSGVLVVPVMSIRGAYDYLTHANAPSKAQYDKSNLTLISGFSIEDYCSRFSESQALEYRQIIFDLILRENIDECVSLLKRCHEVDESGEIFNYCFNNLIVFSKIVDSVRYSSLKSNYRKGDKNENKY